jgi:glycerophosphoryl diester phosphodiesterase
MASHYAQAEVGKVLAIAHRGHSSAVPENTLAAFDQALAAGVDLVEVDVRLSRDGVAVCCHDADLARMAGSPALIAQLDERQLRGVALIGGGSIPSFAEVVDLVRGRAGLMLDVKVPGKALLKTVLDDAGRQDMRDALVMGISSLAHLADFQRLATDIPTIGILSERVNLPAFFVGGGTIAHLWGQEILDEPRLATGWRVWSTAGHPSQPDPPAT